MKKIPYHFPNKIYNWKFEKHIKKRSHFWPNDKNCPTDLQELYFVKIFHADNFEDKTSYLGRKNISK